MSGLKKQIKYLLLFSVLLGMFFPNIVVAEEREQDKKGKMEIKTNRITEYRDQVNDGFQKTELEKRVPMLFDTSTYEKVNRIQEKQAQNKKTLKHDVLVEDIAEDSFINEVQNALFTGDYEVTASTSDDYQKSTSEMLSTSLVITSFILLGLLLCIGIYFFVQKWSSS